MTIAETSGELRAGVLLRVLALALAPPTAETRETVVDVCRALAEEDDEVDAGRLADAFEQVPVDELRSAQQRWFGGAVAIAPYESSYERDPFRQARVMSDIAGFYLAFGADAHGPAAERPDHAGTELEFLGLLASERVTALERGDPETAERLREIEDGFLTDHAGRWLPGFFRALAHADPDGPYGALGLLGEQAIAAELVARGLEVTPVAPARAPRTAVEDDEVTCAAGDEPVAPGITGP